MVITLIVIDEVLLLAILVLFRSIIYFADTTYIPGASIIIGVWVEAQTSPTRAVNCRRTSQYSRHEGL